MITAVFGGDMKMPDPVDITNKALAKMFSIDFLVVVLAGGVAWGTLSSSVDTNAESIVDHAKKHTAEIKDLETDQRATGRDVQDIKVELGKMSNNQEHFKEKIDEMAETQKETLRILRREYPRGSGGG